jgi:hypothetical protein
MKESRQRQLLEGQSSVARKVFEGVPIQEAWAENEILKAMRTSGVTIAAHTIRACLLDMKDVGLIKEPRQGQFQRAPVQPYLRQSEAVAPKPVENNPIPASEPVMQTPTAKTPTPLDLLGTVATELVLLSSEFSERMKALADRVEDVALSVAAQRESDAAIIAQATQLKELLKGFGQ